MSSTNVAIIGSNGFIGRHLTNFLSLKNNIQVHLFGRSSESIFDRSSFNYKKINLLNSIQNAEYFKNIDIIYYLVSETIPANSWENPLIDVEKNLIPFLTFAECISKLNVKKIVYLSSAGTVYGTTHKKVDENYNKNPFSPYGITKLAIENFLMYYEKKHKINCDIYRISNVYGEGQDTTKGLGLINTFLEKSIVDHKIKIFGDGNNLRNYIYVKDVAQLLGLSLTADVNTSETYNLSSNDTLTINQIVDLIKTTVSEPFQVEYVDKRESDNTTIDLDNTKILKAVTNFNFTPIKQGMTETYNFIKNNFLWRK
ncbi:NAD-dependent epimerase/dehydratase family protein [Aurantibacillus circumpalustris]|uniref:NAD-dependent epimerase/dehydratase family protein n=1 Tax=Aurantibacillus circumpalustris TaxID=3036359 RepID=UPI00295B4A57|nr:NAD-dependent epimerase/dehydratase family protein [Aurantibacillus circumpalustris]